QPAAANPAAVGPVDDPLLVGGSPAVESPGAVLGSAPSVGPPSRREPDADDQRLRELVAFMARGLVDHPQDVQVDVLASGSNASFELRVHPDDLGHVIGKQGRTARSLTLALGASA